jgi:hypothetical protein
VVKPTPVKAEIDWSLANSWDRPVSVSAAVAKRVMRKERVSTTRSVRMAVMARATAVWREYAGFSFDLARGRTNSRKKRP